MSGNPLPSSFDGNTDFYEENRWQKLSRRLKEEPLIPLGCVLTCMALLGASRSIRSGDHNRTNRMFRARIYAQGFTLVAMVAGSMYWESDRKKRKEFDAAVEERKAKEKNELWIKELEARDEEDKEIRAMRKARRSGKTIDKALVEKAVGKSDKSDEGTAQEAENAGEAASGAPKRGILDSVQGLVWGGKK